jgi:hypothetical protein
MAEKPDKRIGATKESIEELKEKLGKIEARLAPPGEEYTKIAQIFLLPIMRGDAETALKLDEESRNIVLREIGKAWCESLRKISEETTEWEIDWLKQVAMAAMSGLFRGIHKLDEETKRKVLREQARVCFHDHIKKMAGAFEKAGISFTEAGYTPEGAVALFGQFLTLRDVTMHKDTIFWIGNTREHYDRCCCPIYRTGVIDEQLPEFCECAAQFMKYQFEYMTGQPMESELVETLNCGNADVCSFRTHTKSTQVTA